MAGWAFDQPYIRVKREIVNGTAYADFSSTWSTHGVGFAIFKNVSEVRESARWAALWLAASDVRRKLAECGPHVTPSTAADQLAVPPRRRRRPAHP